MELVARVNLMSWLFFAKVSYPEKAFCEPGFSWAEEPQPVRICLFEQTAKKICSTIVQAGDFFFLLLTERSLQTQ